MGRNSKQRRDAKRRKARTGGQRGASSPLGFAEDDAHAPFGDPRSRSADRLALAELEIAKHVRSLARRSFTESDLDRRADSLIRWVPEPTVLSTALEGVVLRVFTSAVGSGWSPPDLAELVSRHRGEEHLPLLSWLLADDLRRNPALNPAWVSAARQLPSPIRPAWHDRRGVGAALGLAALLGILPETEAAVPRYGAARHERPVDTEAHRKLATVRGLLAKAESTLYDDEAEALTAKAQELISRYALERLLESTHHETDGDEVVARKIWVDSPYVLAKATLIDVVAHANRARTVLSERLGLTTVIGADSDLDAVELLSTSLLTQATAAMLRHGTQVDRHGASRTRSFRQAFLVAYAHRIGQRLAEAGGSALHERADADQLLPVLHRHDEKVTAAFTAMFPQVVERATTVSNAAGYAAGQVAADLATLSFRDKLSDS